MSDQDFAKWMARLGEHRNTESLFPQTPYRHQESIPIPRRSPVEPTQEELAEAIRHFSHGLTTVSPIEIRVEAFDLCDRSHGVEIRSYWNGFVSVRVFVDTSGLSGVEAEYIKQYLRSQYAWVSRLEINMNNREPGSFNIPSGATRIVITRTETPDTRPPVPEISDRLREELRRAFGFTVTETDAPLGSLPPTRTPEGMPDVFREAIDRIHEEIRRVSAISRQPMERHHREPEDNPRRMALMGMWGMPQVYQPNVRCANSMPMYDGSGCKSYGIGDTTCKYNAKSPYLRCAVNPDGPCSECNHRED